MDIYLSQSTINKPSKREGFFLKVFFTKNDIGYSSYFPWVSLGQASINEEIKKLRKRKSSLLTSAWKDCYFYRQLKQHKLPGLSSHSFLMNEKITLFNPDYIKVKLYGDIDRDLHQLNSIKHFKKIRLDANFKYDKSSFQSFIKKVELNEDQLDFIEDPIPWNRQDYLDLIKIIPLAIDQPFNCSNIELDLAQLILKPNLKSPTRPFPNAIFTHNMGHDLDLWHTFLDLLYYGNGELVHGIAPAGGDLFKKDKGLVFADNQAIKNIYNNVEERQWILI